VEGERTEAHWTTDRVKNGQNTINNAKKSILRCEEEEERMRKEEGKQKKRKKVAERKK
jgi:hypothetical protein